MNAAFGYCPRCILHTLVISTLSCQPETSAYRPGCAHTCIMVLYMSLDIIAQPCLLLMVTYVCAPTHIYSSHRTSAIYTCWRPMITNQPTFLKYTNANKPAQCSWPTATCGQWTYMCKAAFVPNGHSRVAVATGMQPEPGSSWNHSWLTLLGLVQGPPDLQPYGII